MGLGLSVSSDMVEPVCGLLPTLHPDEVALEGCFLGGGLVELQQELLCPLPGAAMFAGAAAYAACAVLQVVSKPRVAWHRWWASAKERLTAWSLASRFSVSQRWPRQWADVMSCAAIRQGPSVYGLAESRIVEEVQRQPPSPCPRGAVDAGCDAQVVAWVPTAGPMVLWHLHLGWPTWARTPTRSSGQAIGLYHWSAERAAQGGRGAPACRCSWGQGTALLGRAWWWGRRRRPGAACGVCPGAVSSGGAASAPMGKGIGERRCWPTRAAGAQWGCNGGSPWHPWEPGPACCRPAVAALL